MVIKSEFDKDPWHKQIQNVIDKRNNMCAADVSDSVFEVVGNPFLVKSLQEFEKANPLKVKGKMRCVKRQGLEKTADKDGRFFTAPVSKSECRDVDSTAVWGATSLNRGNRYGKGVCWANKDEEVCGNRLPTSFLQQPMTTEQKKAAASKAKAFCEGVDSCAWNKNDCMTKAAVERGVGAVTSPPKGMPTDITKSDAQIQRYMYDWYVNKKHGPSPKVGELIAQGNRCGSSRGDSRPSLPQSVVNMIMKNMNLKDSGNRGMLAWHSTGSGKTCTATGVMDSFWDSGKQIVFASSIDAIASNPPFKFQECSRLFKSRTEEEFVARGVVFKTFAQLANNVDKVEKFKKAVGTQGIGKIGGSADKRKSKMTLLVEKVSSIYGKDESKVRIALDKFNIKDASDFVDLDNTILIIDEVHNLFRPLANQRAKHRFLEKHLVDPSLHPKLKIVILTATPGDNVTDTLKLLNIIRDPLNPLIVPPNPDKADELEVFKEQLRGLVSYFDMSNDLTKFPTVEDNDPVRYPMSEKQFEKYVEAYKGVVKTTTDYEKLANANQLAKYWQGVRKYANMLYTFDKNMALTEFSSKLPGLLDNIGRFPLEKHYVYSAFYTKQGSGQGIREIARQLDLSGYTRLTVKDAKTGGGLVKGKRYILALKEELGTGAAVGRNLHELLNVYNSKDNERGELCHVFLASQGFNEGLDLKAVRHIHMFEPLVTAASDYQTIGRARRYCSHADLDHKDWSVKIHRYLADYPVNVNMIGFDAIKKDVTGLEEKIAYQVLQLESTTKGVKKALKEEIAGNKRALKELKKEMKISEKMDVSNIRNIDDVIYNEAKEHMRKLLTVHHCIKEAAVDCRLLHKFHGDKTVRCAT